MPCLPDSLFLYLCVTIKTSDKGEGHPWQKYIQKKKHWRSPQSSTNISCRDWKLLHAIRSRKSDRIRSYKILCKTEKIKKYLPVIISSEKSYPLFMIRCFHLFRSTFRPFTGLVDKYSEKPEKLIVF